MGVPSLPSQKRRDFPFLYGLPASQRRFQHQGCTEHPQRLEIFCHVRPPQWALAAGNDRPCSREICFLYQTRPLSVYQNSTWSFRGNRFLLPTDVHLILRDLLWTACLCYLDDIVVYARTPHELLSDRGSSWTALVSGLKVKPSKCELFKTEVKYLVHMITANAFTPARETRGNKKLASATLPPRR